MSRIVCYLCSPKVYLEASRIIATVTIMALLAYKRSCSKHLEQCLPRLLSMFSMTSIRIRVHTFVTVIFLKPLRLSLTKHHNCCQTSVYLIVRRVRIQQWPAGDPRLHTSASLATNKRGKEMDTVAEAALSMSKYRCARGGSLSVASSTMSKTMAGAKEHLSDSPRTHHYYPPSLDLNDFGCQSGLQLPDI